MNAPLTIDVIAQFRDALAACDLNPPEIEADGQLHRFDATDDKKGKKSAWYVLHDDGLPAGSFGNWKTDFFSDLVQQVCDRTYAGGTGAAQGTNPESQGAGRR